MILNILVVIFDEFDLALNRECFELSKEDRIVFDTIDDNVVAKKDTHCRVSMAKTVAFRACLESNHAAEWECAVGRGA